MVLLLTYLFLALFISFLCSIMESVLLSVPISYLKAGNEMGNRSAGAMLKMKEDVDKPLSAILTLNTIAHTIGAAGVGAQATIVFGEAYFGLVSAILTILILVFTEIIPKTLGTIHARSLIGFATGTIRVMIFLTYPLVLISSLITRLMSRSSREPSISREEVSALANIGTEEGVFAENENKIIQNLIKLKNVKVTDVMTPRVVIVSVNEEMTLREFMQQRENLHFSRIPVYHKDTDNISGYIFRMEVFEQLADDHFDMKLRKIRRDIVTFSPGVTLLQAWNKLLEKREHISLVVNEYGGVEGILTLEDIIETLLGMEIVDEKDKITDMRKYALEKWEKKQKSSNIQFSDNKD